MGIELVVKITAVTALLVPLLSLTQATRQKVRERLSVRLDINQ